MTPDELANLLAGAWALAVAGGVLAFIYGPWQTHCVEWARDRLFQERDALFDLAASGSWSFESEDYQQIRREINVFIRYADMVQWWRLVLLGPLIRRAIASGAFSARPTLFDLCDRIDDPNVAKEVRRRIWEIHKTMKSLITLRSPAMALLLFPMTLLGLIPARFKNGGFLRALQEEADTEQITDRRIKAA